MATLSTVAGTLCSAIFMLSAVPMLHKALATRAMRSSSGLNLGLTAGANLLYWLSIISLPVGPIDALHGFCTVLTGTMLVRYLRYRR